MNQKLMYLFVIAFGAMVLSCGDDEPKIDLPNSIKDSKTYSYGIINSAGATFSLPVTMKLSDFTALNTYEKYVTKGVLDTDSYIEFVKGASANIELKDVTLQIKSNPKAIKYSLGTITGDKKFDTLEDLIFLRSVVDEMIKNNEAVFQPAPVVFFALSKRFLNFAKNRIRNLSVYFIKRISWQPNLKYGNRNNRGNYQKADA